MKGVLRLFPKEPKRYAWCLLGIFCGVAGLIALPISFTLTKHSAYYKLGSFLAIFLAIILFVTLRLTPDQDFKIQLMMAIISTGTVWIVFSITKKISLLAGVACTIFWVLMVFLAKYQTTLGKLFGSKERIETWKMLFGKSKKAGRIYDEEESSREEEHKK